MPKLRHPLSVTASFFDPSFKLLARNSQVLAKTGEQVPLQSEGVFLKGPVPIGSEFEVICLVEDEAALTYRGVIPIPLEYQSRLANLLSQKQKQVSLIPAAGREKEEVVPVWKFIADVWCRVRVTVSGFTEYEVHVGQEGIGTPKNITSSQFWTRVV
jgi:hypothetical protein